ncbi:hypothetical protein SYNPS1DRAFT_30633 [Syncephalis pseudoplumigaleata]|uniref:Tubulin--tyrosine ligase-like protein 12 SET-like domain-containing protein n=1 Tax=Syncephalis pseudoplumigaleata TaxID=1712513 RepID=A0A4P9YV00_9FUNG|nr:hypothetical protein SYNPS1DRAFT_30633 [Syncephalis pseudoplumigaleata]|eukprot:RKP23608.1 hypothetical protein SYNPS1DRAFT_30633 [Syncephalis pseudoplumigaleata]
MLSSGHAGHSSPSYGPDKVNWEGRRPISDIPDRMGAALQHSPQPNFRSTSFMELTTGRAYTLLWPIDRVECGQTCTVDLLATAKDEDDRRILACAYMPDALATAYPHFSTCLDAYEATFKASAASYVAACDAALSMATRHESADEAAIASPLRHKKRVSYWLDPAYRQVQEASVRTSDRFVPASRVEDADIVWIFSIMSSFPIDQ